MVQQLKPILQQSLTFVESVYAYNFIYILTRNVCESIKATLN